MDPLGLVEIEQARIARFEAERIADEEAKAQAVLDAIPTEKEVAARELQERRDDAYDSAVKASTEAARIKCGEVFEKAYEAFKVSADDPTSGIVEWTDLWLALVMAHAGYVAATVEYNNAHNARVGVVGGLVDVPFDEVVKRIIAGRASIAGRVAHSQIAQDAQDAGGVAAAKVK
jgi:hypothetical protein